MTIEGTWPWALWAALRVFALVRAQVLWARAVGPAWPVVAIALGVAFAGAWQAGAPPVAISLGLFELVLVAGFEFGLGTVVGLVVALPGLALVGAADVAAEQLGLRMRGPKAAWTTAFACIVLALSLALGVHRPWIAGVYACLRRWPVGEPSQWLMLHGEAWLPWLIETANAMVTLALAFATPVVLTVAVVDGLARWLAPGGAMCRELAEGARPWIRTAAALLTLWASWSAYPTAWARVLDFAVP